MQETQQRPSFPRPDFTTNYSDKQQRRFPQCIAHRGFSAKYPENTMAAFKAAVDVGAHALEMDLQLTKDGILVISHDPTLQSQFGRPAKIADHEWHDMQDLKTVAEPHEPVARLIDILTWLSQPEAHHVWILLEIKVGANAKDIMQHTGQLLRSMPPAPGAKAWNERIVITVLPPSYLTLVAENLPGFPVAHVGFSRSHIQDLLPIPGLSFNIAFPLLVLPGGSRFLTQMQKKHDKPVYAWVVDEEHTMKWCIWHGLDGVLTDDPEKFLDVCKNFDFGAKEPWFPFTVQTYWAALVAVAGMAWKAWTMKALLKPLRHR
ncbi:hypothetical protein PRZ48_007310 [Zasmidium cellare]|uniref:GP-PDE domain-containing protein n=1 Tax=Zasmidium cellare TaxID=395010 RepID=A0ABR0EK22_ZASCE|nr:hypothetical protein PRZ48_007310 [Zasmidium cellare]